MTELEPFRLTPQQIDAIVHAIRSTPGDHISRGKIGDGYAYSEAGFRQIWVEEEQYNDAMFADEPAFRAHLADLDLHAAANSYRRRVFEGLGLLAPNAEFPRRR